jgi:hypothetical protein
MALKSDNLKKMTENHKNIGKNGRTVHCLPGNVILKLSTNEIPLVIIRKHLMTIYFLRAPVGPWRLPELVDVSVGMSQLGVQLVELGVGLPTVEYQGDGHKSGLSK